MFVYLLAILFCFIGKFSYPWEMTATFPRFLIAFLATAEIAIEIASLIGRIFNLFRKRDKKGSK